MRTVICFLADELFPENESFILQFDDEQTMLHLYTGQGGSGAFVLGKLLQAWEENGTAESWLIADRRSLTKQADIVFGGFFHRILLCPAAEQTEENRELPFGEQSLWAFKRLLSEIREIKQICFCAMHTDDIQMLQLHMDLFREKERLISAIEGFSEDERLFTEQFLRAYAEDDNDRHGIFRIYLYSFLLKMFPKEAHVKDMLSEIRSGRYGDEQKYFIFQQLNRFPLINPGIAHAGGQCERLYQEIVYSWKEKFCQEIIPLPEKERNKNRLVVIMTQFLMQRHAPTKTALERIYTLGKCMGRELLCINTREQYTLKGLLPCFDPSIRILDDGYTGAHMVTYKEFSFPLFQPETEMPDPETVQVLLEEIRGFKPYEIVVIGNHSIVGDLCAEMIPTVCIPLTFSTIPEKQHQFVATGRKISREERERLERQGRHLEQVIESTFTFELNPQKRKIARKELGLPEKRFLMVVVGLRLDVDVSEEFLQEMMPLLNEGAYLVFAGYFDKYGYYCGKYELLKNYSSFLGYQNDMLALMEICDLYLNPPRIGGGFSVIEAFYQGVPGITLPDGDVAEAAGEDFRVKDLTQMRQLAYRYMTDRDFYRIMSDKAKKRTETVLDSERAMRDMLNQIEHSSYFF